MYSCPYLKIILAVHFAYPFLLKKYHAIIALRNYIINIFSITIAKIDFFMDNLEKNQSLVLTKRRIFAIIFSTKRQTKWGRIYGNRKLY